MNSSFEAAQILDRFSEPVQGISFDLDHIRNKTYLTHNYHPFPAKFIPQIPSQIIEKLSHTQDHVLDPFCGSGTSLVEACLLGRASIGVDINPLACLIAKVKTKPLNDKQLRIAKATALKAKRDVTSLYYQKLLEEETSVKYTIPEFHNKNKWFESFILRELAIVKAHIDNVEDTDVKDFLKIGFSAIIVSVSNQESDTRYAAIEKNLTKGITIKMFEDKIDDMSSRMIEFRRLCKATVSVYNADAGDLSFIPSESVDLVVTSPPFPNTYDYYLYHKFRMIWLSMDYRIAQEKEIGSRHKHSDRGLGIDDFSESMTNCIYEMHRLLRNGKYCCIVIGDVILRGQYVKMNELIAKIAKKCGLSHIKEIHYPLRKYTKTFTPKIKTVKKLGHIMFFKRIG